MFEELGRFLQGYSVESYKLFGTHKENNELVFRIYAPYAKEVELKASFNNYEPIKMNKVSASGVFEVKISGVLYLDYYYNVLSKDNKWIEVKDTYSFILKEKTFFYDINSYIFKDERWLKKRNKSYDEPMSIYDYCMDEKNIDLETLCSYLKEQHYTHVKLNNVVREYYGINNEYGNPDDLKKLIDTLHQNNIGVLFSVSLLNDYLKKVDEDETIDLNKNAIRSYLMSSVGYFIEMFHVDGIVCEDVDSLIELEGGLGFVKRLTSEIKDKFKDVVFLGKNNEKLGFDYNLNFNWLKDTLKYMSTPYEERKKVHALLSESLNDYYKDKYILPLNYIEDEIYGNEEEKKKQIRALYAYLFMHPGKKIIEISKEKNQQYINDLNEIYCNEKSLFKYDYDESSFVWMIKDNKRQNIFSFYRKTRNEYIVVVINMSNVDYEKYEIGVPEHGYYEEILNSNNIKYGGSSNPRRDYFITREKKLHNQDYVMNIKLPSLSVVVFRKMKNV